MTEAEQVYQQLGVWLDDKPLRARLRGSHMTRVFVFGSNLAGRHGRGAALAAKRLHGAVQGVGEGRTGSSYAIPTKDRLLTPLPLPSIEAGVGAFLAYAWDHPECRFVLTRVGCGLAGYTDDQIAPMFRKAPWNCDMPDEWRAVLAKAPVVFDDRPV